MSKFVEEVSQEDAPKPLTAEEAIERFDPGYAARVQEFLDAIEESAKKHDADVAEIKALIQQCLDSSPVVKKDEEVESLKQEIVQLKAENSSLKQQIADMWASFSAFMEKTAQGASKKWQKFFAKEEPAKTEVPVAQSTETPSM